MAITANLVKELRQRTGSGMMDCKRALVQTQGDLEAAIDLMRASGAAKAAKKSSRIATEGVVRMMTSSNKKHAIMIEINSETDFVTKSDDFINFVDSVAQLALNNNTKTIESLLLTTMPNGQTVADTREALVAKIGENISVRRLQSANTETGSIGLYQHGERIATMVVLETDNTVIAKDIAMHIAASNPECVEASQVPEELLTREKAIFIEQAKESGKPDNIIEKMISGRMKKFITEITLYGQSFIKNPDITIAELVKDNQTKVLSFTRYEVGEGIEKAQADFRQEVMDQAKSC